MMRRLCEAPFRCRAEEEKMLSGSVAGGAVGGDGTLANPFGTVTEGLDFVSENGTIYLLRGNYPLTTQFNLVKAGVTLEGSRGTVLTLEAALIPFLITAADVTLRGLTLTSDAPYANEWIQVGGDGALIEDNTIFGPHKSKRFDTDRRRG